MQTHLAKIALTLVVTLAVGGSAAERRRDCPDVSVSCPDSVIEGEMLTFTAELRGGDKKIVPTYHWTVSAGSIISGQGTSTIQVDTSGVDTDSVSATVEVGGFDRNCSTSTLGRSGVRRKAASTKVGEYPEASASTVDPRLDGFARELEMDPQSQGYVIAYGGRIGKPGEAREAADAAKAYLITKRAVDAKRIVTVDGGFRENFAVELWIVPDTATPPTASPTVQPSEVKAAATPSVPKVPASKPAAKRRKKRN